MAKLIGVHYDFNGNEIQNAVVHNLAAAPAAVEGKIYYDNSIGDKAIYWYDGAAWRAIRFIDDAGTTVQTLWSADKIQTAIDAAVTAAVTYKGGLNASVPTPNLNTISSVTGDMYTVTVAGTITFTTGSIVLEIGDVVLAEATGVLNNANQWTVVEKNLTGALQAANDLSDVASAVTAFSNIKQAASTTATGVVEIATTTEVNAEADTLRVVTPETLGLWKTAKELEAGFDVDLNGALGTVVRVFSGGVTTYTVNHNLGTLKTHVTVRLKSSEAEVSTEVISASTNTTDVILNGDSTDNTYNVHISG